MSTDSRTSPSALQAGRFGARLLLLSLVASLVTPLSLQPTDTH